MPSLLTIRLRLHSKLVNKIQIGYLKKLLFKIQASCKAWEDREFVEAVKDIRRKNIIMTALWTEACLAFPTLDALSLSGGRCCRDVGRTSVIAHETAL